MERDEDAKWSNPRVLTIFAVIFLCGAMAGAVGMRAFLHVRIPFSDQRAMDAAREVPIQSLTVQLNLTPVQQKAVMAQLDEYGKYYQNIQEERADVARHGIQAIMACLNEEQRSRFAKMFGGKR